LPPQRADAAHIRQIERVSGGNAFALTPLAWPSGRARTGLAGSQRLAAMRDKALALPICEQQFDEMST
jgi:hypothetical protein